MSRDRGRRIPGALIAGGRQRSPAWLAEQLAALAGQAQSTKTGEMADKVPSLGRQPGGRSGDPAYARAPDPALGTVAARACRDAQGVPATFLEGYLQLLSDVSDSGRRVTAEEREARRVLGAQAAEEGVPLRGLVDLYLSATWLSWSRLPGVRHATAMGQLRGVGEAVLRAVDAVIVAVAEGYESAQRVALRQEESLRREFVDDLLHGRGDMTAMAERAERFGLRLAGVNVVAVVQAPEPILPESPTARSVETALLSRITTRSILLTTKDGLLACVAPAAGTDTAQEFVQHLETVLGAATEWQVGVGRAYPGPGGVVRSFEEARRAIVLADQLGIDRRVVHAAELLVFPVLLRDTAAITDLVTTVLGPLQDARGGAAPLVGTLAAYFGAGNVATEAARRLHVGVRTVTYRLERIRELTGYSVDDALERYTLETAVLGARLLDWPASSPTAADGR